MYSIRTRVKMCGMTRAEDIAHAATLGVDAIGLIFYEKSKRHVSLEHAKKLVQELPPFVDVVAVLVNPDCAFVQKAITELPISLLQFHGDEAQEFCQQFGKPFIKAIQPYSSNDILQKMNEYNKAKAILLDTPSDESKGGTGLTFDWSIVPINLPKPFILAGGLNQANVAAAIKGTQPYAVDVCSGIEASPGIKDHLKMSEFIRNLSIT